MKSNVPSDPIETMLSLQGIDENHEEFPELYDSKMTEMGMNLPLFYFSISDNHNYWLNDYNGHKSAKKIAAEFANRRYNQNDILKLVKLISSIEVKERRSLLLCQTPQELKEKIEDPNQLYLEKDNIEQIKSHLVKMEINKGHWHFPILAWHGLENQYHNWISNFIVGNYGVSLVDAQPVFKKLWSSMKWTLILLTLSLILSTVISFILGTYNGINQGSRFDRLSNGILFLFYSIPKFWLATLMIIFFTTAEYGNWTNIFSSVGDWPRMTGFFELIYLSANKLILPVLVIVIPDVAYLSRLIRASIIDEYGKEYIKVVLSKGVSKRDLLIRHLIPNSLVPTITLFAGVLPGAIGSSLIIEVIFNIPGIGRLMYDSIKAADWAVVFPIIMIVSILTVIIFLLADVLIAWLNPKIKMG